MEEQVKMKRLTLDIPAELHKAIKIDAARQGVAMADQLRAILAQQYRLEEPSATKSR